MRHPNAFLVLALAAATPADLLAQAGQRPSVAGARSQEHLGLSPPAGTTFPAIGINDNRIAAGRLVNGVLTIRLEVRTGTWSPEDGDGPGVGVHAFAEEGKPLLNPGPVIRVPVGTVVSASVRNSLASDTVTISGLGGHTGPGGRQATVFKVAPGAEQAVRFTASATGTFYYTGQTTRVDGFQFRSEEDSQLNGFLIVDGADAPVPPRDRAFLISWWNQPPPATAPASAPTRHTMVINGRPWPKTERFDLAVGDSLHWRWANVTEMHHPMHLHGFYYTVESRGGQSQDSIFAPAERRQVVTERLAPGSTMSLTWTPERPGNWLFHCHMAPHMEARARLSSTRALHQATGHTDHDMGGLVLGLTVRPGAGTRGTRGTHATTASTDRRRLRVLVRSAPNRYGDEPGYAYVSGDSGSALPPDSLPLPGRLLVLERDQPVAITVVNHAHEPTAVHWHGIELDSYTDGIPGWSGSTGRILRAIAPRDSFVAEFTPPRSGTFIYHSHYNETQQIGSGLYGALIVLDPGTRWEPETDRVIVLSTGRSRTKGGRNTILVNGSPDEPMEFRAGTTYRLRFINIFAIGLTRVTLADSAGPVRWRPVAKDGGDLPPGQAASGPSQFRISAGETADFLFTPTAAGELRLLTGNAGRGIAVRVLPAR